MLSRAALRVPGYRLWYRRCTIRDAIHTVAELPAKTRLFRILSELAEELGIIKADKLAQVGLPGIPDKEDKVVETERPTTTDGATQTANPPTRSYAEAAASTSNPPWGNRNPRTPPHGGT